MTFEGRINEILPDGRFGVTLENGHQLIVYTAAFPHPVGRRRRRARRSDAL